MDTKQKIAPITPDGELVVKALQQCPGSYDQLYERYHDMVKNMLLNRTAGDTALAEDIMQEAFVKAFLNLYRFDTTQSFGPWIYTIANNIFIDYTRRTNNIELPFEKLDYPSTNLTPEQEVINKQKGILIDSIIEGLPEHYREIFMLRYIEELSYEEISIELNIPIGTVKTRLHRSKNIFIERLRNDGSEER